MTFDERTENFEVKYGICDNVRIISREYEKRFAVNRTQNIDTPDIDIPEGKTNKNNKKNIF